MDGAPTGVGEGMHLMATVIGDAFDLEYEAAQNYLLTDFRWWVQLTSQKKVIIRSCDDRSPTAGLIEWIDDQEKAIKDERHMLRAQNKSREQETIGTLALYAGTVALGLLLGLTSRPKTTAPQDLEERRLSLPQ